MELEELAQTFISCAFRVQDQAQIPQVLDRLIKLQE